jgi:hypothetical protein
MTILFFPHGHGIGNSYPFQPYLLELISQSSKLASLRGAPVGRLHIGY